MIIYGGATEKPQYKPRITEDFITLDDIEKYSKETNNEVDDEQPIEEEVKQITEEKQQLTEDQKEQLIRQMSGDSEYLKKQLSQLSVEGQLEMLLDIYHTNQMDDPKFLQKIQKEYCFAESVLYKLCTLIGLSDDVSKTFSKAYLETKLAVQDTTAYKALSSTFEFIKQWSGLLVIVLFEWIMFAIVSNTLEFMRDVLSENSALVEAITSHIDSGVGWAKTGLNAAGWVGSKLPGFTWALDGLSALLTNSLNYWGQFQKMLENRLLIDGFAYYSGYVLLATCGVVLLLWAMYLLYGVFSEVNEITRFCGENIEP